MWGAFFIVGALLKALGFDNDTVWLSLAPDASLWAVGVLVADFLAHQQSGGGEAIPQYTMTEDGYTMRLQAKITGDPRDGGMRFVQTFFAMAGWLIALMLTEYAIEKSSTDTPWLVTSGALLLAHAVAFLVVRHAVVSVLPRATPVSATSSSSASAAVSSASPEAPRTS